MPDNSPSPNAAPASPTPSSTPPGTTAGAPTASAVAGWRAPASAGWAAGKTPEEILGIADALVKTYTDPRPAPAPAAPDPAPVEFADDDYITGAQLKRMMAVASQPHAGTVDLAASANYGVVQQRFAADFGKYGAEIQGKLAAVPKHLWTLDNLETVVKLVRSDHLDEIAHERAQQLVSGMEPTLRSNGASASPAPVTRDSSLDSEKIPADWKRRAVAAGITERVVDEFCRANDMTPEAFYKQFETPMTKIVEDIPTRKEA